VKLDIWQHLAAVKRGSSLMLYVNGEVAGSAAAPPYAEPAPRLCALGGNPLFSGNEFLSATFADLGMWGSALSAAEVRRLAGR